MVSLAGSQLKRETPVPSSSSDFELCPPGALPESCRTEVESPKARRIKGSKAYAEPRDVRCKDHNQNVQGETRLSKMKRQQNATASKAEAKHGQGCNEFRKWRQHKEKKMPMTLQRHRSKDFEIFVCNLRL